MTTSDSDALNQVEALLRQPNLSWLLGAGICKSAGLPLMRGLTKRVTALSNGRSHADLLTALVADMNADSNIEQVLSQLGDYIAISGRSTAGSVQIRGAPYSTNQLEEAHKAITSDIANTIRWGYVAPEPASDGQPDALESIGTSEARITKVDAHLRFVRAIFELLQAGLTNRRRPLQFFTTNYDTLLEDALALGGYRYWDGFSGGAIAFREHRYGDDPPIEGYRAKVIKLHGSIDWIAAENGDVVRVRDTDAYPDRAGQVLIYPQSTKYIATQKDPFAAQFSEFRRTLTSHSETVLAVCGYSFGDDHINEEIRLALSSPSNKTTVLAFCREEGQIPAVLNEWREADWGNRLYVLTQKGIYCGSRGPVCELAEGQHDWWSFTGLVTFLENGGPGDAT